MGDFENYWPGEEFVDVASVWMGTNKQLSTNEYERLVNLVGHSLLSMEDMFFYSSAELLSSQPKWSWFTADKYYLVHTYYNSLNETKATLNSPSVINRKEISFIDECN